MAGYHGEGAAVVVVHVLGVEGALVELHLLLLLPLGESLQHGCLYWLLLCCFTGNTELQSFNKGS